MAGNDIAVRITAESSQFQREISKVVGLAQNSAKQISNVFSVIGKVAAFGGIGTAAVLAFQSLRQKAEDSERSINQLNAVLRLTGSSAGLTARQIEELGKSVEKNSIFDDEQIRAASTALLRFRSIQGDTFRQILQLAPDAATVLGTTLPAAAELLGRAFTDPSRGLRAVKAVGVEVSEQQIDLAARLKETGDVAGSQAITLEALRKVLGGSGEADTKGLYGVTKRLSRAFDDLEKAAAKKIFSDNVSTVESAIGLFERWGKRIDETSLKLSDLGKPFELWRRSIQITRDLFNGFQGPAPGEQKGRLAIGKIDTRALDEADAQRAAEAQRQKEQDDQQYVRDQLRIKKQAANAATYFARELNAQKHFIAMRQSINDFGFKQDTLSAAAFYTEQRRLAEDAARAERENIGKQIEAKVKATKALSTTPEERANLEAQIFALAEQHGEVRLKLEENLLKIQQDQSAEIRKQGYEYDDIALRLTELTGSAGAVAAATLERANRDVMRRIGVEKNSANPADRDAARTAENTIALITKRTLQQVDLNEAQRKFGNVLESVSLLQGKIDTEEQLGAITEIDALNKKADAARSYIGILRELAAQYEEIAKGLPAGAAQDEAILKAQGLRAQIDQLEVSTHALEITFRKTFEDAFASNLTDVVMGTKSLSAAFKDMEKQIVASISHIASQNIAQAIFGTGGVGGSAPGMVASLFGAGGNSFNTMGMSKGLDSILFSIFGGAAGGGSIAANRPIFVGEKGPELFVPQSAGNVIPNDVLAAKRGGQSVININVNVDGATTRATADQVALRTGVAVRRALSRNG